MPETVRFSKDLYPADAVRRALEAYAQLAKLSLEEGEHELVVHVADADPDVDNLVDELCNHALHETILLRTNGQLPV